MAGIDGLLMMLVYLVIVCLVLYLVFYLLNMLALPQPARTVALVMITLIILVWFFRTFGFF